MDRVFFFMVWIISLLSVFLSLSLSDPGPSVSLTPFTRLSEDEPFRLRFNPENDPRAAEVCSLFLSVLTQTSAMYSGGTNPAVLMYLTAHGFHRDAKIDPRVRSLILQGAKNGWCKRYLENIHLLVSAAF